MHRTAVSIWFSPERTITEISGCSSEMADRSSSPDRCGMVRSSRMSPMSSPAKRGSTSRLSLNCLTLLMAPGPSRVMVRLRSQGGSSSTRRTPKAG